MQNFNIEIYTNTINNLKNQIESLQKDCELAEKDLEKKYERVAQAPKEKDLLEGYVKSIEKSVQSIDLEAKRKNLMRRLGGEFDYDEFYEKIDELHNDFN